MMDNYQLRPSEREQPVAGALGEALVQLEAGDLAGVKVLLVECRLYLAEAVAADSTKH